MNENLVANDRLISFKYILKCHRTHQWQTHNWQAANKNQSFKSRDFIVICLMNMYDMYTLLTSYWSESLIYFFSHKVYIIRIKWLYLVCRTIELKIAACDINNPNISEQSYYVHVIMHRPRHVAISNQHLFCYLIVSDTFEIFSNCTYQ